MLATKQVWKELVKEIQKLRRFKDVRAYPFNRMNDAAFLKDFPGLRMPACLVVYMGTQDTAMGQGLDRIDRWTAVVVCKDAGGDAWETSVELVDKIRDQFLDRQILEDELTIHATNEVNPGFTMPKYSVYGINFETRQVEART
jgi:hypothetical protein